jgi:hypothetical protein
MTQTPVLPASPPITIDLSGAGAQPTVARWPRAHGWAP